ncbi:multicopper oxidase domain-containing protein [Bacillus sp. ISL-47]|uniref:multicopper oxidase family protein n=1 Tax=Bacillus sp. ISL-47 TaxID=2819130 RepID=UPI001BE50D55|nr:multicopper oxidase domain-containing protein [Bacillus sp. ISL-47]MBT2686702.1 multicopper oxidase domain-containing protein [Bacillus sp. ISL-47]MBT2710422.1 multicopper oxidase domain-containing protein [Pseudomonas sp. ISL-84]
MLNGHKRRDKRNDCYPSNANLAVRPPGTIPKFVDELPIPKVLKPVSRGGDYDYYEVEMKCARHKFHRDLGEAVVYGYNGMYPGPTIEAMKGRTVMVKWINNLPLKHFLPVDKTLDSAIDSPEVRTVVHLHGANVAPDSDGHPDAWFTRNYGIRGPKYSRQVYEYPNQQQATTLWYHDHAMGVTRLNLYAGLAGFYLLHDFHEQCLNLPKGKYDIPLMIQDKTFREDGSLFYPPNPTPSANPSVVRAFIGNTMVVNGKVWPYLNVEPRKYRFRMLNASNTNGFTFKLKDEDSNLHPFWQIGTDGGMIEESKPIEKFPLDPAERLDVIIDFSNLAGKTITLRTEELDLAGNRETFKEEVMQFRVGHKCKGVCDDDIVLPMKLRAFEELDPDMLDPKPKVRRFVMTEDLDKQGRLMLTINHKDFRDPATELPEYDSIEVWELANPVFVPGRPLGIPPNITHPIHLHLAQFQVLNRQEFNVNNFNTKQWIQDGTGIQFVSEEAEAPDPSELGWKDTVRVEPGKVTRIVVPFKNYTGEYVWHCHILEHEDHEMMRPLIIVERNCE